MANKSLSEAAGGRIAQGEVINLISDMAAKAAQTSLDALSASVSASVSSLTESLAGKASQSAMVAALAGKTSASDVVAAIAGATGTSTGDIVALDGTGKLPEGIFPEGIGAGIFVASVQTADFTPEADTAYPANTTGGPITCDLASLSTPLQGDRVELYDPVPTGSWDSNPVTVTGKINSVDVDMIITDVGKATFEYVDASTGWLFTFVQSAATAGYRRATVSQPSITSPADDATDILDTPTLTSSAFAMDYQSGSHDESDWQIASDSGFSTIVVESLADGSNLTSWTVPAANLQESTEYFARVRYRDANGNASAWSATISFTTIANFFETETFALIAEMDPAPSEVRKSAINTLIRTLKDDSIWDELDRLWVMKAHDAQAAKLDWKNPATSAYALTEVGSPTFTADVGYTGNGSSSYLNTNFNPSTDGVQFTQNGASMGVYLDDVGSSASNRWMGAYSSGAGYASLRRTTTAAYGLINGASADDLVFTTGVASLADQLVVVNRDNIIMKDFADGSQDAVDTDTTSVAVPNQDIFILAHNGNGSPANYSDATVSAAYVGDTLPTLDHNKLATAIATYVAAVDAE
jgi:hypothetical protein